MNNCGSKQRVHSCRTRKRCVACDSTRTKREGETYDTRQQPTPRLPASPCTHRPHPSQGQTDADDGWATCAGSFIHRWSTPSKLHSKTLSNSRLLRGTAPHAYTLHTSSCIYSPRKGSSSSPLYPYTEYRLRRESINFHLFHNYI